MSEANITQLLHQATDGSQGAADALILAVYQDLRRMAQRMIAGEPPGHILQPTALVNEACLRLFRPDGDEGNSWKPASLPWNDRVHFMAVAATQMRRVLVDYARERRAAKRDFGIQVDIAGALALPGPPEQDYEEIDGLLNILATRDPVAARVIELKFFGGLTDREAAFELGVSVARLRRDWEFARGWLRLQMQHPPGA